MQMDLCVGGLSRFDLKEGDVGYRVDRIMCDDLVTAHWTEDLTSAYKKMCRLSIRHLPVLDDHGDLVGIISDRDFQRAMRTDVRYDSNFVTQAEFESEALVRDYMSQPVKSVGPETDVKSAARLMIDNKISSILVVDDDFKMLGIVTPEDLMKLLIEVLGGGQESFIESVESLAVNSPMGTVASALSQAGI
jgi:acetoin utilization protein AcuB